MWIAPRHGYFDVTAPTREEPKQSRRGSMAEERAGAARKNGRPRPRHRRRWRRTNQVHRLMHPLHPPHTHAVFDRTSAKARETQLFARDHVVLASGDASDRTLHLLHNLSRLPAGRPRARLFTYQMQNIAPRPVRTPDARFYR
jgi:hypothetical protein